MVSFIGIKDFDAKVSLGNDPEEEGLTPPK